MSLKNTIHSQAGIEAAKKSEETGVHSESGSTSGNDEQTDLAAPAVSIHQAAKSGDITTVRKLIEKDSSLKTYALVLLFCHFSALCRLRKAFPIICAISL